MERQKNAPLRGRSRKAWRGAWLLASTALSAVLAHPVPAHAQSIGASTTPQGGAVVGGSASIAQATGSTTITQSSNRAAINWQSYNVGSDAHVTYVQPSTSAITLNRVVTPSPSVIAGHISANGQIVLINQSGVVFTHGAEVTAQSVIVSTSDIKNSDFMAGRMNFTGTPSPGAKIVNDGEITAGQAGLVGLVAPQVANNGLISARLGQVVLAGADAFTLDLYGDKLVSLDVTKAVREVDLNGKTVPALVTNKGLIVADGGRITITASDADALVSQLLQVGGTLRANSADGKTGTIALQAVGGGINIAGNLLAQGTLAGSTGGNVEAMATGTVAVASSAVIDTSGQAGGGNIALGTNLQRVAQGAADTTAPRAQAVSIASGAEIKADAISKGNGGKVTLLSARQTDFQGTISTAGGQLGGNGGDVEISSDGVISLGGTVIDTAIGGQAGEILLDPQTLVVTSASTTSTGTTSTGTGGSTSTTFGTDNSMVSYVDPSDLAGLHGTVILDATHLLSVASAINLSTKTSSLQLTSGQDLTISASISLAGALDINAAGTLDVGAALNASTITLADSGAGNPIDINGVITGTELVLTSGGMVTEGAAGGIAVTSLTTGAGSIGGDAVLSGTQNTIATLAGVLTTGTLNLTNNANLTVANTVSAADITLAANGTLGIHGTLAASNGGDVALVATAITESGGSITAPSGTISIAPYNNGTLDVGGSTAGGLILSSALLGALDTSASVLNFGSAAGHLASLAELEGNISLQPTLAVDSSGRVIQAGTLNGQAISLTGTSLSLNGTVNGTALGLAASGAISQASTGALNISTLSGGGSGIQLAGANSIGSLGALSASGNIVLDNTGTITLGGAVSAGTSLALATNGLLEGPGGSLSAATIALAPYSNGAIDLGGSSASGLQLSQALVSALNPAAEIILGNASGHAASSILTEGAVSFANALLSLDSTGGITQNGTLTGTTLDLNAASMALNGLVNASQINLSASSAITQASTGALSVSTLSGTAANLLLGGANTISTLNSLSATGTISLQDTAALNVNGNVAAGSSLALSAPGLTLASTLSSGRISLTADSISDNRGAVNAAGGTVSISPRTPNLAVDLGGSAAGLDLSGTLLGAITAAALDVSTQGSIIADGSASIAATLLSLSGNGITFAGTLTIPGRLALSSGAGVTATTANHLTAGSLLAGGVIAGNVNLSQGSNSIGALGSIALNSGNLTLADATALAVNGPVSANAISLTGTSFTFNAPVSTGTLTLFASNGVNETGGGLSITALTGSVSGNAALNGGVNHIGTLANFTDNGSLTLADNAALTQAGSLAATNATLSAAGLNFTGSVTTPGTLAVGSSNGVSQSGGSVNTGVLSSTGPVNGNIILTQAGNQLPAVQNLAATGVIDLASSTGLNQTGLLSASAVTLATPALAINGTLSTSGALQLNGGTATEGAGGVTDAALLTTGGGALSGDAVFNNSANNIAALGNFTANGGLALADGAALSVSGPVSLGGTLALTDSGNITQTAGTITAAALTSDGGTIGGSAAFGQAGNAIPVLGAFAAKGNLLLSTGGALTVAGNVNTGGTLSLYSGGTIGQSGGLVTAARFNASGTNIDLGGTNIGLLGDVAAASDVSIANAGGLAGGLTAQNATLGSSGGFTASGTARIANALYITAAGAMNQTGGTISAATATITAPSITLSGAMDVRNELALRASGNIIHESGSLNAGTLTGTAGQLAEFGAATDIGTLSSFLMADSVFMLTNDAPLTLIGPVVANAVSITAAGALVLDGSAGGGLYLSGSTIAGTPLKPRTGVDSILAVTGNSPSITQYGTFNVDSGLNAAKYLGNASPQATLFMSLANSGTIGLAPAPGVLNAPNTELVLAAGAAGAVNGNVSVLRLVVLSAQSVQMTGSIGSISGPTAAGKGIAFPFPQPGYRFNTCPIGSVNCTILPIEGLPQANPLQNFNLSPRKRRRLDKNVTLPGVAARDF
ncbi:MAG: filamentous hemagglutinin N-terminal domain-containing protein [Rhodospirillales bacterium]|nr:filamentous hemagglutinin N-terminal domain-containing protein [Rhodospirillales bacterium]